MSAPAVTSTFQAEMKLSYPFLQATIDTLRVQCNLVARPGTPYAREKGEAVAKDVAALVNIHGPQVNGCVAICFPKKVFLALMESMLGEKYAEITPELEDGASELLNIMYSQAKKMLADKGYQVSKAVPAIVVAENLSLRYLTTGHTFIFPFETNVGHFHIEITTEQT